jgi:AAA domain
VIGLQGTAGAGKTTSLVAIRVVAGQHGYDVEGLAPTSRAVDELAKAGIRSRTLQYHLTRGRTPVMAAAGCSSSTNRA